MSMEAFTEICKDLHINVNVNFSKSKTLNVKKKIKILNIICKKLKKALENIIIT